MSSGGRRAKGFCTVLTIEKVLIGNGKEEVMNRDFMRSIVWFPAVWSGLLLLHFPMMPLCGQAVKHFNC